MKELKQYLFIVLFLSQAILLCSQSPAWIWANHAGTAGSDSPEDLAVDNEGNTYIVGTFAGEITFGTHTIQSLYSGTDIYVAKADPDGQWLWAKRAGAGSTNDYGVSIAPGPVGTIYVAAYYSGNPNFLGNPIYNAGSYDVLVAKMNSSGDWIWVACAGGSGSEACQDLSVDDEGSAYLCGTFYSSAYFGSHSVTSSGGRDVFIAKVNSAGTWQMAQSAGGSSTDNVRGIAVDGEHNIYLAGGFSNPMDFGPLQINPVDSYDIYLAKANSGGTWIWASIAAGNGPDNVSALAVEAGGCSYLTGYFNSSCAFGGHILSSAGDTDAYIAKADSSGAWVWAARAGGNGDDTGSDVCLNAEGNVCLTGSFEAAAMIGNSAFTAFGTEDSFLATLDPNSTWLSSIHWGGSGYDTANIDAVATDPWSNYYVCGTFTGTVSLDDSLFASAGSEDIYAAKYGSPPVDILPPENVNIAIADNNVTIGWDAMPGALSYLVEAADLPDGSYTDVSAQGSFSANAWTAVIPMADRKFYRVRALY
jgi:hypothetical protein